MWLSRNRVSFASTHPETGRVGRILTIKQSYAARRKESRYSTLGDLEELLGKCSIERSVPCDWIIS